MMPNLNNLAATLVSEKGETLAKSGKAKVGKSSDFTSIFGNSKTKKSTKKTGEEATGAGIMPQVQLAKNPIITKNSEQKQNVSGISKAERADVPKVTNNFGIKAPEQKKETSVKNSQLEVNATAKVLGNRIESTQSKIFTKTDGEVLPKNIQDIQKKSSVKEELGKIQNLKKDLATNEGLKVREKSAENTINFSKEVSPQWNGRSVSTVNELTAKSKVNAKDDLKLAVSDNKIAEPNNKFATISSYGLKKMNDQFKLEDKVEGIKELKVVEKNSSADKVPEKNDSIPLAQNFTTSRVDSKGFVSTPVNTDSRNDFNAIMQQVENGIKINYNNQLKEMKIKLQPEELGEVEIKMTMENNIMKAQFVVESQTVKDILESRFDNLRNALENKGFYGAEINVSVSTGENKNANNAFTFNQSDNKRTDEKVPDYLAKVENLENNSKVRKVISDSNVDIMI